MEYNEDDFLQLSGIQHFAFCRRQWALIHIEQLWDDNLRTAEGDLLHENCHDSYFSESRGEVIISRGVPVYSRTLGVSGECDVVEFRRHPRGIEMAGRDGRFTVFPVEYKHGQPKDDDIDILQLTAQAMCLEEMLSCEINEGSIYYGQTKKRIKVGFSDESRKRVAELFSEMHQLMKRGYVPKVKSNKSCNACSLKNLCLPKLMKASDAKKYVKENVCEGAEGRL